MGKDSLVIGMYLSQVYIEGSIGFNGRFQCKHKRSGNRNLGTCFVGQLQGMDTGGAGKRDRSPSRVEPSSAQPSASVVN